MNFPIEIRQKIVSADQIWLLLDYDGTLADFAPTPDDILPDPELISLLQELANHPKISLAIISGRRLSHIEKLVPLPGIWLAGSYGIEMRSPSGEYLHRANYEDLRPQLEKLKPAWIKLIDHQKGFYLEDKGWSLALHARFADDLLATEILPQARIQAEQICPPEKFQILGGHKFLEIAPQEADKGSTVKFLLQKQTQKPRTLIYLGDDDKDEKAFPVVRAFGGLTGCVCNPPRTTQADFLLKTPRDTRIWLFNLLKILIP